MNQLFFLSQNQLINIFTWIYILLRYLKQSKPAVNVETFTMTTSSQCEYDHLTFARNTKKAKVEWRRKRAAHKPRKQNGKSNRIWYNTYYTQLIFNHESIRESYSTNLNMCKQHVAHHTSQQIDLVIERRCDMGVILVVGPMTNNWSISLKKLTSHMEV